MRHPLFRLWSELSSTIVQEMCVNATGFQFLRSNDDLFRPGVACHEAYFVVRGRLDYIQEPEKSPVSQMETEEVRDFMWLCEAALWMEWTHVGMAVSTCDSHLVRLHSDGVIRTLAKHRLIKDISVEYSRKYHQRVISARPPKRDWPSDLRVPQSSFAEIVASMSRVMRVAIGMEAIQSVERRSTAMKWSVSTKLKAEVQDGSCTVLLNSGGQLERMITVAALELERADGRILVQGGFQEEGAIKAACRLPQEQVRAGQEANDVLDMIVSDQLSPFEGSFMVRYVETGQSMEQPRRSEVQTRYLRTVFHAILTDTTILEKVGSRKGAVPARVRYPSLASTRSNASKRMSSRAYARPSGSSVFWRGGGESPMGRELCASDIWAIASETGNNFFAWLHQEEFELLGRHERYLQSVLSTVQFDAESAVVG